MRFHSQLTVFLLSFLHLKKIVKKSILVLSREKIERENKKIEEVRERKWRKQDRYSI